MAPSKERLKSDSSDQKAIFKCSKKKSAAVVCVKCGNVFHKSCVTRDWAEKVHFIDETRVICCKDDLEVSNEIAAKIEITYLKRLLTELEKQNKTLEENGNLWRERYETLEKNSLRNPSIISRIPSIPMPSSPRLLIPDDAKAKDDADDSVGTDVDSAVPKQGNGKGEENPLDGASLKSAISNGVVLNLENPSSSDAPRIDRSNVTDDIDNHAQQRESAKKFFVNTQNQNNKKKNNDDDIENNTNTNNLSTDQNIITLSQVNTAVNKAIVNKYTEGVHIDKAEDNMKGVTDVDDCWTNSEAGWTLVSRKNRRGDCLTKRPPPKNGTNDSEVSLKTAIYAKNVNDARLAWMFVSGLDPSTQDKDVLEFLEKRGLRNGCVCYKMNTRSNSRYSSFKLGVPETRLDEFMSAEMWPRGIWFNHFRNLQSHRAAQKT